MSKRGLLLAAASAGLLAGCGGSLEDRINAAVPPSQEVEAAKAGFDAAAKAMEADTTALEADYAAQLKIRALECSHGVQPSLFASEESIREQLGDLECFKAADVKLLGWLGMRRIGWLAAMPPLHPVPEKPAAILPAPDTITATAFAEKAGVAVLQSNSAYVVLDFTGAQIRKGEATYGQGIAISANGRLLTIGSGSESRVIDVASGETLATVSELRSPKVHWVGDKGLLYLKKDGGLTYRDLSSGVETAVPMTTHSLNSVVRLSEAAQKYVLVGQDRVAIIELLSEGQSYKPRLVREEKLAAYSGWDQVMVPAHGALVYGSGNRLSRLDLATLATETVDTAPLNVSRVVPTRDPDQVLLSLRGFGFTQNAVHSLSLSSRKIAAIDANSLLSSRLLYVPSANSNALIDGAKVVMLDKLSLGEAQDFSEVVGRAKFEAQIAQLEMADQLQRLRGSQNSLVNPSPATAYPSSGSRYNAINKVEPSPSFSAGKAGLVEAMRAGRLRLGGPSDIGAWKSAYMSKQRRSLPKDFDDRMRMRDVYVVTGSMTIPTGLFGAHAVVFVVNRGVPFPSGDAGHSLILDMDSGNCAGATCRMSLQ